MPCLGSPPSLPGALMRNLSPGGNKILRMKIDGLTLGPVKFNADICSPGARHHHLTSLAFPVVQLPETRISDGLQMENNGDWAGLQNPTRYPLGSVYSDSEGPVSEPPLSLVNTSHLRTNPNYGSPQMFLPPSGVLLRFVPGWPGDTGTRCIAPRAIAKLVSGRNRGRV